MQIGDQVCVKRTVAEPRYAWGGETHHSVGKIIEIDSEGLLIIEIPNRSTAWQADPFDMEKVENFMVCFVSENLFLYKSTCRSLGQNTKSLRHLSRRLVTGSESKLRYRLPNMDGKM